MCLLQTVAEFVSQLDLIFGRQTMIQELCSFQNEAAVATVVGIEKQTSHSSTSAYELKFLINESRAVEVLAWARRHMTSDPHVEPSLGDAYRISSLYLDTPALDVFCHRGSTARSKLRLRRYGEESSVFLERKRKRRDCVEKRRVPVLEAEMRLLQNPDTPPDWTGRWFHKRLRARRLQPICQVSYERAAYVAGDPEDPLRLTLDRRLRCVPATEWAVPSIHCGMDLLPGKRILELKYRGILPTLFKRAIRELCLRPTAVSKYRLGVEACKRASFS
jgi:VTC domain-containing protein